MEQVLFNKENMRCPVKLWLPESDFEEGAAAQAINLANLPFTFKWVSIMPDSHQGYGMPIGGVLATKGVVVPNAVGVDIGCGMCSLKTYLKADDVQSWQLEKILNLMAKLIPTGTNHHKHKQDDKWMPDLPVSKNPKSLSDYIIGKEWERAKYQVGTLGGGNHFIELQKGDDGYIWIMIHSGSRNFGYKTAKYYNELAQVENAKWFSEVKSNVEMAFFPQGTEGFEDYLFEQKVCVSFALKNRELMMERTLEAMTDVLGPFNHGKIINKAHNFVDWENHYNTNVLVHRKGACRARRGEIGMIPGSQGTKSYIVEGLGEKASFTSCSHGAGRKMSRSQARKELDLQAERSRLEQKGVLHMMKTVDDLDEAPSAYKDIDEVMMRQSDLVKVLTTLEPLAVLKAHGGPSI